MPRNPNEEAKVKLQILRYLFAVQAGLMVLKDPKPSIIAGMLTNDFLLNFDRYADAAYGGKVSAEIFDRVMPSKQDAIDTLLELVEELRDG